MMNPTALSPGSNMPNYPWLAKKETDFEALPSKIKTLKILGVPFADMSEEEIIQAAKAQASSIAANLKGKQIEVGEDKQIVALISYLQQLGKSDSVDPSQVVTSIK